MSTVGTLIDRLYREWLTPPSEQPVRVLLTGTINSTVTTVNISTDLIAPELQELLSPGLVIEVGSELMLITDYDSGQVTVQRGFLGTTAAAHTAGDAATLSPKFTRRNAFEAVADEIVSLHPALWGVATETLTSDESPVEVDADVVGIAALLWTDTGGNTVHAGQGMLLRNYPPSASGKAIQFTSVPSGNTVYATFRKEFPRATAETQDLLTDLYVQPQWEEIVVVGAAARLSAHIDPSRLFVDWASEAETITAVPTGTGTVLERRLKSVRNDMLQQAARRMRQEYPPTVSFTNPFNPVTRT